MVDWDWIIDERGREATSIERERCVAVIEALRDQYHKNSNLFLLNAAIAAIKETP